MTMTYFTDEWAVVGTIDPDANTAATYLTDAIDMALYDQVVFINLNGTLAGTVDFKVTQATTAAGTYKDVTSAAITQIADSPVTTQNDTQQIITVDQTALDMDNDYRYVKGSLTTGGTNDGAVIALGRAKSGPASDNDLASVSEIVHV